MSGHRVLFPGLAVALLLVACGSPVITQQPQTPAIQLPTVQPSSSTTASATPNATPTATSVPTPSPAPSPTPRARPELCPITLEASDFGSEFDEFGTLDVGDITFNPRPGWVTGREFLWYEATGSDDELFRVQIQCYDTVANAEASFDQNPSVPCIDGDGFETERTIVSLPVQLGDESLGSFCPGYGPGTENERWSLGFTARLGAATISIGRESTEELTPDDVTVSDLSDFAIAFLLKAAR